MDTATSQLFVLKISALISLIIAITFAGSGDTVMLTSWVGLALILFVTSALLGISISEDRGIWVLITVLFVLVWARVSMKDHRVRLHSVVSYSLNQKNHRTSIDHQDDKKILP